MYLSTIASMLAAPLAATSDELQPWMVAAIAAGALLALLLIIVAARKSRKPKGEDLREAMSAAKREAAGNTGEIWKDFEPVAPEGSDEPLAPVVPAVTADAAVKPAKKSTPKKTASKGAGKGKSKGKHAK